MGSWQLRKDFVYFRFYDNLLTVVFALPCLLTVLQIEAPLILVQLVFLSQQGQHFPILLSVFGDKGPVMKRLISLHTNILTHDEHRHRFLHRQQGMKKRNSGDSADGSQAQLESI